MKDFSYITNSHPEFIENLYRDYMKDPESVDPELKKFFEGFDFAINNAVVKANGNGHSTTTKEEASEKAGTTAAQPAIDWMREIRVYRMILGFRNKAPLNLAGKRSGLTFALLKIDIDG